MIWLAAGLLGTLLAIYMARPRFERRTLSSARFFFDLPQPKKRQPRLRFGRPIPTRGFALQCLSLLLVLSALLFKDKAYTHVETRGIGLWVLVDTSASMTTLQQGEARSEAALRTISQTLDTVTASVKDGTPCYRVSAFDLERRDIATTQSAQAAKAAIRSLAPRPLGTDLSLIRHLMGLVSDQEASECPITHLIVVTDWAKPHWTADVDNLQVIWHDVGRPVDNLGFTAIRANRNPLTGLVQHVQVEVTAYGAAPGESRIAV
ncbi:vWA domain-containing protein [Acidobacteriota bacterium]